MKPYNEALKLPASSNTATQFKSDSDLTVNEKTLPSSIRHADSAILMETLETLDPSIPESPLDRFDLTCIQCPLVIFYGSKDEIVDAERLVKECQCTVPQVQLIYAERIDDYEHLDVLWATNAKQVVFDKVIGILNKL